MKHCRYCGRLTAARCMWPKLRTERVRVASVQLGDRIVEFRGARAPRVVVFLQLVPAEATVYLGTEYQGRVLQAEYAANRDVLRAVEGTCGAPCCCLHRRSVGPQRSYCERHWRAWEEVA